MSHPFVMEFLKEQCKSRHLQVRAGEYARKIMEGSLTFSEYKMLLLVNYYFHNGLEQGIRAALPKAVAEKIHFEQRLKTYALLQELDELELSKWVLHWRPKRLIHIRNTEEALGALYVTEGTAIGGAVIRKKLLANPQIGGHVPMLFFGCYGKSLSFLWKNFAKFMDAHVGVHHFEAVKSKAEEVFEWYEYLLGELQQAVQFLQHQPNPVFIFNPPAPMETFSSQVSENPENVATFVWDLEALSAELRPDQGKLLEEVKRHQHSVVVINLEMMDGFLDVSTQNWAAEEWVKTLKHSGVKKIGVIVPKKVLGQIVIRNIFGGQLGNEAFQVLYFNEPEEVRL